MRSIRAFLSILAAVSFLSLAAMPAQAALPSDQEDGNSWLVAFVEAQAGGAHEDGNSWLVALVETLYAQVVGAGVTIAHA